MFRKNEIFNVLSGKSSVRNGAAIQAVAGYLNNGTPASRTIENSKYFKEQEAERLELYITGNDLWVPEIDVSQYVSEGAEQKVFLRDNTAVQKLNDCIYYDSWEAYCHSLLLHNFFFPDTAYSLEGFTKIDGVLFSLVTQPFVRATSDTDLGLVKQFLQNNGFENTRNNDYYHPSLGIILEDLHDENVLTGNDLLYFIDTVFFLTPVFWENEQLPNSFSQ